MNICENYTDDSVYWHETFYGAYRLYVSPSVAIFGILGNILVIAIYLLEHKKSRFSIYCIAISFTHIVILITNSLMDDFMGSGFDYYKKGYQIKFDTFSLPMCRLMEFIPNSMYTASSGLLLVFSVDRIVTIFQPMKFYSVHYRKFAIYICTSVVILCGLINVPMLVASNLKTRDDGSKKCTTNDILILGKLSIIIKVFVTFVVPTFIILIVNIVICLKLWRATIKRKKLMRTDMHKNDNEMNRICGHLALNTAFLLFTFPLVISMIMRQINPCSKRNKDLSKIFSSIKDMSYALDIVLYAVFLTNFRWRIIRYCVMPLLCCKSVRSSKFGTYLEVRLIKFDSNSSRRKYSVLTSGVIGGHNHKMLNALMFRQVTKTTTKPKNGSEYGLANPIPISTNSLNVHNQSSPTCSTPTLEMREKRTVSYADEVTKTLTTNNEELTNKL